MAALLDWTPGQTIADEVLMRLPFTPEVMQVKMRIVLNRHIGETSPCKQRESALTQPRRWADPQADHERNIDERGRQSRMSSEIPWGQRDWPTTRSQNLEEQRQVYEDKETLLGRMAFPRDCSVTRMN
jgi:hypothetical protein